MVTPSVASLIAVGAASGTAFPTLPQGLTWPLVVEGAVELEALGVVAAGTAALVRRQGGS